MLRPNIYTGRINSDKFRIFPRIDVYTVDYIAILTDVISNWYTLKHKQLKSRAHFDISILTDGRTQQRLVGVQMRSKNPRHDGSFC